MVKPLVSRWLNLLHLYPILCCSWPANFFKSSPVWLRTSFIDSQEIWNFFLVKWLNLSKSGCYLPTHVNGSIRQSITHLLRKENMDARIRYLGMPLFWGRYKVKRFYSLCDNVSSKINSWDSSSLSEAGPLAWFNQ